MSQVLGDELDTEAVLRGEVTPMFFGSAMTNFGVELFLRSFIDSAARPGEGAGRPWMRALSSGWLVG